jgi:hypothetical protein
MKNLFLILFILTFKSFGQDKSSELLFNEYIGYVKKFHPLVKSANLEVSKAQAI